VEKMKSNIEELRLDTTGLVYDDFKDPTTIDLV
jgi:hypothetical protein